MVENTQAEGKKCEQLSYSSASQVLSCEQKYWHRKIAKTPIDPDAEESTDAFDTGKAFHQYLEDTEHKMIPKFLEKIREVCEQHNVKNHLMVGGMVLAYLKLHEASELKVLHCELQISDEKTLGFIDAIMLDELQKELWIVDLKTASKLDEKVVSKLPTDYQLNLYASYAHDIMSAMGWVGYKFAGCRYRVTEKSKLVHKDKEMAEEYMNRVARSVQSVDFIVPVSVLNPAMIRQIHSETWELTERLRQGEVPKKNFSNCMSYFRPCEYYSKCHGRTYTQSSKVVARMDAEDLINNRKLLNDGDLL